jgi:hypothetical protein
MNRYACGAKDHWADILDRIITNLMKYKLDRIFGATPESKGLLAPLSQ